MSNITAFTATDLVNKPTSQISYASAEESAAACIVRKIDHALCEKKRVRGECGLDISTGHIDERMRSLEPNELVVKQMTDRKFKVSIVEAEEQDCRDPWHLRLASDCQCPTRTVKYYRVAWG
jgi:hypothetical protein